MTSQKLNLRYFGIGLHIQEEQCEKCPPAKNEPVSANWWGRQRRKLRYDLSQF